ncbi:MAG: hypothetical protein HZC47_01280 [Methanobacterium sp.]|uniref:hypothetical protein n=1 Tax=Methanobacterium sp. TaxID=2164 RepID=UPI003D65CB6A|nr:hypothetical protein [Methanobacterium sp.]
MNLKAGILIISLVIGLLGVPNCIFAQEYQDTTSNSVLQSSSPAAMQLNSLNPEVKGGGGGGGRGGGSSGSKSSSSKKVKDGDSDDNSTDDGSGWGWTSIIIILIILGVIGAAVWYFMMRK